MPFMKHRANHQAGNAPGGSELESAAAQAEAVRARDQTRRLNDVTVHRSAWCICSG